MTKTQFENATGSSEEEMEMKQISLPMSAIYDGTNRAKIGGGSIRKGWIAAAVVSSFMGMTAAFAGLFFMILAFFEPTVMHSRLGGLLLMSIFPLFFLAAHALDRIDAAERAERVEKLRNCRENSSLPRDCQ